MSLNLHGPFFESSDDVLLQRTVLSNSTVFMSVSKGKKFKHEGKPKSSKMTTLFSCKSGYIQWNSVVSVALAKRIHELRAEDKSD